MLDEAIRFLEAKRSALVDAVLPFSYEIIVVSDGSRDGTVEVAQGYSRKLGADRLRVLALETNRGKGGAVRLVIYLFLFCPSLCLCQRFLVFQGVQCARGKWILFADADGATHFPDLDKLTAAMDALVPATGAEPWRTEAIAIGSRAHLESEAIAERSLFRTILMHGFHFVVWLFAVRGIRDTQCGFKLFSRSAAATLFGLMHVERWAFDVELLFIAQHFRLPIAEIAVKWTEIDGSKVTPVWSWLQMGRDLCLIWFRYTIGAWSLERIQPGKKLL